MGNGPLGMRAKIAELEAENERLRAVIGLEKTDTPDRWALHAPQDVRDRMAAQALILEKLDEPRALKRLGFNIPTRREGTVNKLDKVVWTWCEQVFGTPGVQRQLAIDMADAEKNKSEIIARLVQTARHGDDGDSVRAAQQLSKMADWNEGDKAVAKAGAAKILNLLQMAGDAPPSLNGETFDPNKSLDAADFLEHDPTAEGTVVVDVEE